jgi:UDP-N-acetylmuramate--alanine ligase
MKSRRATLSLLINGKSCSSLHFVGILGSGMSAIAYYCLREGMAVTGSDRLTRLDDLQEAKRKIEDAGGVIFQQDGSAVKNGPDAVVVSTAIEESNPDIVEARNRCIPIIHRSDALAALALSKRTIAIAGTSGKSTVAAMTFEMLTWCGMGPSLITGANLNYLEEKGLFGNAFRGESDLLVIEADESDGSLVKYAPEISLFLNVSKDHKPVVEVIRLFQELAARSKQVIVNADDPALRFPNRATTFGLENGDFRPDRAYEVAPIVRFSRNGVPFELALPGRHNLSNAIAALCVCAQVGCDETCCAEALRRYRGVKRRFNSVKLQNGIMVVDDFAHNPEKVKAALTTAQLLSPRVLAIFQPHGFGPTRFLKDDFAKVFTEVLREGDLLFLLPIYYAGGTTTKDISSDDLANLIREPSHRGQVFAQSGRPECLEMLWTMAKPGDAVLLMGARDPSLSSFARDIVHRLQSK